MWYKTKLTKYYHKQHLSLRSNFWSPKGLQSRHTKVSHMRLFPVSKITGRRYKFRQVLGSAISLCLSIHKNRTVYCDAFQRFNPQNINKSYVTQPLSSIFIYTLYVIHTFFIGRCAQMTVEGFSFEYWVIQPTYNLCIFHEWNLVIRGVSSRYANSYKKYIQGMPTCKIQ